MFASPLLRLSIPPKISGGGGPPIYVLPSADISNTGWGVWTTGPLWQSVAKPTGSFDTSTFIYSNADGGNKTCVLNTSFTSMPTVSHVEVQYYCDGLFGATDIQVYLSVSPDGSTWEGEQHLSLGANVLEFNPSWTNVDHLYWQLHMVGSHGDYNSIVQLSSTLTP